MDGRDPAPGRELEEARREAAYYRRIAEEAGTRRLREAEALSRLLDRAEQAERELQRARDELERRVEARTAELTVTNDFLSRVLVERERAEVALRASEEAFRSFMAHFPGLAFIKEADTTVVFANEGFRTYLELAPEALEGKRLAECLPEPDATRIGQHERRVLETGRAETIEEELGGRSWVTHLFVIPRAAGGPRLGGLSLDVTEAKRSEQERRRLERQMEQAQRLDSLGVLAGGIAHDFNNLLTTIAGNVAILRAGGALGAAAEACLADVDSAARTAAGLCQQMLAYAGRAPLSTEPLDLGVLVRDMVQLLRSSVSRRLGLDLRLAEGLPPVRADPTQLRQVVMNLVLNAAEALGEADGTVTVTTGAVWHGPERAPETLLGEALAEGRYVFLEVTDGGRGMDAETQRRIFEPFFSTKFAGRGLGLSAVLGIVRQLQGGIELQSAPGRGTRFRVLIPASEAAPPAYAPTPAPVEWRGSGVVLVVDDEAAIRRLLARLLEGLGFEPLEAAGGAEAIALYERNVGRIRAVILDLVMPHVDGVEVLRAIRRLDPDAYVVVASGYATAEVEARFHGVLPDAFVQKPLGLAALREHLRAAVARGGRPAQRRAGPAAP